MSDGPPTVHVEVTNTLATGTTGIQRVVRSILNHAADDDRLALVPVVAGPDPGTHRRLTADEAARLAAPQPPAPGRLDSLIDRLPARLRAPARAASDHDRTMAARRRLARWRGRRGPSSDETEALRRLRVEPGAGGSGFVDLEAAWHDPTERAELLPAVRRRGGWTGVFVHDLLPIDHPEWFEGAARQRFVRYVDAHLAHADVVLVNSDFSAAQVRRRLRHLDRTEGPEPVVVPLGADLPDRAAVEPDTGRPPTLLHVGTVEPRKNLDLVVDVFERLADRHPDLELRLVGRAGWDQSGTIRRIRRHAMFGQRLHWEIGLSDAEVEQRYADAHLVVVASKAEGYGLPVVEALARGTPVVTTDGGALAEVGVGVTDVVPVDDVDAMTAAVERHLTDPDHHRAARSAAAGWRPPTWPDATRTVVDALVGHARSYPRPDGPPAA